MKTIAGVLLTLFCMSYAKANSIDTVLLKKHITYLAGNHLKGRAPGTTGEKLAAKYIAKHFAQYGLIAKGEKGYFQKFVYHQSNNPHDTAQHSGTRYTGTNVIGYLDNGAAHTIIIGAHYDHLGTDGRNSSLEKNPEGKIHHGADDNASGTAGVLELARYYTSNANKEPVNFLFMCYSAEEAGLIGSKYFTNHPTVDLAGIHCMLNMDMIGRLNDSTGKLMIYGVGTSDVFVNTLESNNRHRFQLVLDSAGVGPSDQTSFYLKKIPVLHFFTGQHKDYHKPSDDAHKINYTGEKKVLQYMIDVTDDLARQPKLKFFIAASKQNTAASFKVTLGIMPDYAFQGKGLRIDAVNQGKPAEKAGLKDGDIIIQLGTVKIESIYDYMDALSKFNKGETTKVVVKRGEQKVESEVTF